MRCTQYGVQSFWYEDDTYVYEVEDISKEHTYEKYKVFKYFDGNLVEELITDNLWSI